MRLHLKLALCLTLCPGAALAHVGHLGEYAGHDHWVAGAAIGVAVALSLWATWKGKRDDDENSPEEETEKEESEA